VRAPAVARAKRSAVFPKVQTMMEAGVKGFEARLVRPSGTRKDAH
jgi:hypothetical protein